MKLLVLVALVGACSAARLEHLERGYLPPGQAFGQINAGRNGLSQSGSFAQSNQYLPPNQGSASGKFQVNSGAQGFRPSHLTASQQYSVPSQQHETSSSTEQKFSPSSKFSASSQEQSVPNRFQSSFMMSSASQEYLPPSKSSSNQFQSTSSRFGTPAQNYGVSSNQFQSIPQSNLASQQYVASSNFGSQSSSFKSSAPSQQYGTPSRGLSNSFQTSGNSNNYNPITTASNQFQAASRVSAPSQQYGAPSRGSSNAFQGSSLRLTSNNQHQGFSSNFGPNQFQAAIPKAIAPTQQYGAPSRGPSSGFQASTSRSNVVSQFQSPMSFSSASQQHNAPTIFGKKQFAAAPSRPSATSQEYLPPTRFGSNQMLSQGGSFSGTNNIAASPSRYNSPSQEYGTPSNFGSNQIQGASQFNGFPSQATFSSPIQKGSGANQYQAVSSRLSSSNQHPNSQSFGRSDQSRQYLAPKASSQNIPQQAFNEQTGYQY